MTAVSPWTAPVALILAATLGAGAAWASIPSSTMSPDEATGCQVVVWVMQRVGYRRDALGNIIPVDHSPNLTARADAITAALEADRRRATRDQREALDAFLDSHAPDAVWIRVETEALTSGRLDRMAADCERRLGVDDRPPVNRRSLPA